MLMSILGWNCSRIVIQVADLEMYAKITAELVSELDNNYKIEMLMMLRLIHV